MRTSGGVDVYIYVFFTLALFGGDLPASHPDALPPEKERLCICNSSGCHLRCNPLIGLGYMGRYKKMIIFQKHADDSKQNSDYFI
jgi:hypothetical protein